MSPTQVCPGVHKSETLAPSKVSPGREEPMTVDATAESVVVGAVGTGAGGATAATTEDVGSGAALEVDVAVGSEGESGAVLVAARVIDVWEEGCVAVTVSSVATVVVTRLDVTSAPPAGSHTVVTTSMVSMTCCVTVYQTRSRFAKGTAATKLMRGKRVLIVDDFIFAVGRF